MQNQVEAPLRVSVNLKEAFENMRGDIITNYPALAVFTFHVGNLNTLFDQLIYGALDFMEGNDQSKGYDLGMDILIRNGMEAQEASRFVLENIQRILATIQTRFPFPVANSGISYRPVSMRYYHLEIQRSHGQF